MARSARRREVELRVIEKPVVHPDRRFISLVHARRYTGASLLLSRPSTYSHRTVARRRLLSVLSPSARRNKDEKKPGGRRRGARRADARRGRASEMRGEERRGEETRGGREEEEGREKKIVRNNARGGAFSRDYRRAARRAPPPLTGFVNHGRFKVITRRKKES